MLSVDWSILKTLSEMDGVSGHEEFIVTYLRQQLPNLFVGQDRLGSALFQVGDRRDQSLHIMVAAHVDEVGFIVSNIEPNGYLRIQSVGNMWAHVLLNQQVNITTQDKRVYRGIVGSPSVHALTANQRERVLDLEQLYVDIGVPDEIAVRSLGIRIGDMVCPSKSFATLADENYFVGKAFDNRVSVSVGIWLLQSLHQENLSHMVTFAATVQEEVGLRGARTVAAQVCPDIAFAVDTTLAGDTPFDENSIKLGGGVVLNVIDSMTVMNRGLLIYLENLCQKENIPYQLSCFTDGGTDAGNIHKSGKGIIATTLSIPMRYMHTHTGIVHRMDILATYRLLRAIIDDLTHDKLQKIVEQDYLYNWDRMS